MSLIYKKKKKTVVNCNPQLQTLKNVTVLTEINIYIL